MEPGQLPARVHRVQDDEVAELYAVACPRLVGLLTVIGGSHADAEEIAQESFVRLLEHWPKVRTYEDPEGWVRTIAIRMLISRRRRRITAAAGLRRLASRTQVAEPPPVEPDTDLVAALATLPLSHRAVLVLHHMYDVPVGEVASRLRIPVGTVKSRLSRARAALAPFLDDERSKT